MSKKKSSFWRKLFLAIVFVLLASLAGTGYYAYKVIYQSNVNLGKKKSQIIYIPTGSDYNDVIRILGENNVLKNRFTFELLAEKKGYKKNIKPGKYRILAKMGNNALVNLLKNGIQEPVEINFSGISTKKELIARLSNRIEATSDELTEAMDDDHYLSKYGFNSTTVMAMFIPGSYELYWNTSVDEFFQRMAVEYKKFWTDERKKKAADLNLSQTEVYILASIVQAEQCCDDEEKCTIAGLYLNRLKINMALQSDPTTIYDLEEGDNIQRVYKKQTQRDSPYNTYRNKGLPPGPIGFAKPSSIDAVLNREENDYIYMCAKEDFSGKHNFTKSYEQHKIFAKQYQKALNKRNIK